MRRATQADSDVLATIHASAFTAPDAWSRDVFDLQLALVNVIALLDDTAGFILIRIAADEAEVLTLAVAPCERRRGRGYFLVMKASELAGSLGVRSLFLEVSIRNISALALYTKIGFQEVGRRPHYYSDLSDALVMRLDIASA